MDRTPPPGLLTPITIKGRTVRNRIVMPPMASHLSPPDGSVTPAHLDRYAPRAAAGVDVIHVWLPRRHRCPRPAPRSRRR